ncbi:MAG: hydrogenase maturation nickel metallochaperone HypA [Clostridia bacterium]|nr:hydrogenase maturation nickel metallochaperone HypA [Clostridia bacterium]
MHELVVTKQILEQVLSYAAENQAQKVLAVHLQIGALRGVVDEWMQRYFNYISRQTIAEGASLKICRIPGSVVCACGVITPIELGHLDEVVCSQCGGTNLRLWTGQEFILTGIEIYGKDEGNGRNQTD